MVKKYTFRAREVSVPIVEPVTKFGGQPVWLDTPQWPLSRALGTPMRFIGQFALASEIFGACEAQLAYLFMTDDPDAFVDGTWLSDGGENAVILQPGSSWDGPVVALNRGPTLYEQVASVDGSGLVEATREYAVTLEPGADPEALDENVFRQRDEWDRYMHYVAESKLGGTPAFFQYPEYPGPGTWRLLVRLNALLVPVGLPLATRATGMPSSLRVDVWPSSCGRAEQVEQAEPEVGHGDGGGRSAHLVSARVSRVHSLRSRGAGRVTAGPLP